MNQIKAKPQDEQYLHKKTWEIEIFDTFEIKQYGFNDFLIVGWGETYSGNWELTTNIYTLFPLKQEIIENLRKTLKIDGEIKIIHHDVSEDDQGTQYIIAKINNEKDKRKTYYLHIRLYLPP